MQRMKVKSSKEKIHKKVGAKPNPPVLVQPSVAQMGYLESLLETAELTMDQYNEYATREIHSEGMAEEMITDLLTKQRNPILGGFNYQQRDITKMLKLLK